MIQLESIINLDSNSQDKFVKSKNISQNDTENEENKEDDNEDTFCE